MIRLEIEAVNFEELKQKAFEVLGLKEPAQLSLPIGGGSQSNAVEVSVKPETAAKKRTPKQKEEVAVYEAQLTEQPNVSNVAAVAVVSEPEVSVGVDHERCRSLLSQVIERKGMETAINIIKRYGVKKVPELSVGQLSEFFAECQAHV